MYNSKLNPSIETINGISIISNTGFLPAQAEIQKINLYVRIKLKHLLNIKEKIYNNKYTIKNI
jgi:hypothetical protein